MSTVLVLLGAVLVVAAAAASLWADKKNGKSSCGCSCDCCEACGVCHHASARAKGKLLLRLFGRKTQKSNR